MWTTQARCPQGPQLTTADTDDCYRINSKQGNQNTPRVRSHAVPNCQRNAHRFFRGGKKFIHEPMPSRGTDAVSRFALGLGRRQRKDINAGITEGSEFAAIAGWNRIVKLAGPAFLVTAGPAALSNPIE